METSLRSHYDVIESLPASVGDFATAAYKARESNPLGSGASLGRVVLLRLLPPAAATAELRAASDRYAALPLSPNVLTHLGLAESPSGPDLPEGLYAVSEWARGITLKERIKRVAPFSLAVALDISIAVTQALIHGAAHGVEHGDLQASDVLLTPENHVKVADFAIGAAIRRSLGLPTAKEDPTRSVARLMYEMLTGQPAPVDPGTFVPRTANPGIPIAVDGIIQKASMPAASSGYVGLAGLLADLQTAREDARMGKPLVWSPLDAQQIHPASVTAPHHRARPRGPLSAAADEIVEEQQYTMSERIGTARRGSGRRQAAVDDGYDDDEYEPRPSSGSVWVRRLAMTLAALIVLVVVFLCAYFFWLVSNVPSDITVPYLIGKPFTDAQTIAAQQHFKLVEMGHDFSDTWPQGAIYQQDPTSGRSIKSGKPVSVMVSDGPRLLPVPDLSQMTLGRARDALQDANLPVGSLSYQFDNIVPKGIVTSQVPAAGAKVQHDTAVNLTISSGPPPPPVPDNLSATSTIAGEIDVSWNPVPIDATYNVYRDGSKIASSLPQTTYSDVGITDSRQHSYTVSAVDSNGESAQSKPVTAAAQQAPAPDVDNDQTTAGNLAPPTVAPPPSVANIPDAQKQRQFGIRFRVPRGNGDRHNVQIEVQDTTGTNIVYDEDRYGGDIVDETFTAFGNKVIFRIFMDGKLIKQETK